jgi:hypothetical protein
VHGNAKLTIAGDQKMFSIMFEAPAESIVGFEHKAKSSQDKEKIAQVEKLWKNDLLKLFTPSSDLKCKVKTSAWKHSFHGKNHSEFQGEATVACEQNTTNKELTINLIQYYPQIKSIRSSVLKANGKAEVNKQKAKSFKVNL